MTKHKVSSYPHLVKVEGFHVERVKDDVIDYLRAYAAVTIEPNELEVTEGANRVYTFTYTRGNKIASVGIQLPANPATIALACGSMYNQINP